MVLSKSNPFMNGLARKRPQISPSTNTIQRNAKKQPRGILVHPASGLTADAIIKMIRRNKNFPAFLKWGLRSRGELIVWVGREPKKPPGTFSEFLQPFFVAVSSSEWEITTGDSRIVVTELDGRRPRWSQVVTPHLGKKELLGSTLKTGPGQEDFIPADPLHSDKEQVIFGWTVPASVTEQLKTQRGLIVIVTKITATNSGGRSRVFTPDEDSILESVMHEIAVHAGRISQGLPDEHGNATVNYIAEEIGKFFRYSAPGKLEVSPSTKQILHFLGIESDSNNP